MNTKEAVKAFIQSEIAPGGNEVITDDSNLIELGIIDSMGVMKLIAFVEETFSITINPDDLMPENFETLDAISALLDRCTKA
ncbi:MAG: acyl carrier protein [bacterium]